MEVKSYYLKRNEIIVKDFKGNVTVLSLNRGNIMKLISSLDKQIKGNLNDMMSIEDMEYKKYINAVSILTLFEIASSYLIFSGFIGASYYKMILGILFSLSLVLYTIFISIRSIKAIRNIKMQEKMYEGREILINKYNEISDIADAKLVDVY